MAPRPLKLRRLTSTAPLLAEQEERERSASIDSNRSDMSDDKDGTAAYGTDTDLFANPEIQRQMSQEGLSTFEKKCILINYEFDSHGMGRYQWYVWFLCGFGYMLDLLWAQAFGLVLSPIQQEFGFSDTESGNISVAFSAGLTAGAFVWGILVDIIGRKWAFNLTCLFSSIFGLCLGIPNSYTQFLVLTAFVGFGVGGNIPIDTTICLEFIPQNRRFLLALLSIFQPIGVVLTSVIAYGFIPRYGCKPDFTTFPKEDALPSCKNTNGAQPCCGYDNNKGWRYVLYTLGAITLFIFILRTIIFHLQESPKFWCYKGHNDKAIKSMQNIAKINKRECSVTLEMLDDLDKEDGNMTAQASRKKPGLNRAMSSMSRASRRSHVGEKRKSTWKEGFNDELERYKLLFADLGMARLTITTWLLYICDFWGFTVAGFYLPSILAAKNGSLHIGLEQTYRSYVYIYLPGSVGVVVGALMYKVPFVGRKYAMVVASALMGVSIFLFSAVNSYASNVGFNVMEYFFQSMFNAVLYGWTPEAFPAPIRGTACGVASFWGRLFGIVAPLIAQHLYDPGSGDGSGLNAVLYLAGGVTLGCPLFAFLLPNSSMGGDSM